MVGFDVLILLIYGLALLFIFLYSLVQIQLVYHYLKNRQTKDNDLSFTGDEDGEFPFVTIQLPVYNEKYVVERLLKSVAQFDYPKDHFEIQILDDSTDETSEIIRTVIEELEVKKINFIHLQRENRIGFKAGALADGMKIAKGEFLAIFDADFIPNSNFLKKTISFFSDPNIGLVQTKWEHVNENYSWLTRLQAFGLDAHFTVEQRGRNVAGHFINFNGTAGIWRKSCIVDAGGWHSDTLTEDLDLSYRAQMKGWKFKYLENCGAPAELPAEMNALKTQQYRWTKGAAECTRKNLPKLLKSKDFSFQTKVNGIFHLLNSSLFICIVLVSILSLPILLIKHQFSEYQWIFNFAGLFLLGFLFLSIFYYTSFTTRMESRGLKTFLMFLIRFPLFLSVSMGLSLHNGLAAFEGLIGKKTPFIRTPKFNIIDRKGGWKSNQYAASKIGKITFVEILLVFYFLFGLVLSIKLGDYGLFPFLLMLTMGYGFVSFLSIKHVLN